MKLRKKIISLCVMGLCIVTFSITALSIKAFASTEQESKKQQIKSYVQQIEEHNLEVSKTGEVDIPATITLESNITYEQLSQYISENDMDIVQIQARGIAANGERITFAAKTYKGLIETDQILKDMAADEGIEFLGYNSMYVLVDSADLLGIQDNNLTFLIETSILEINQNLTANNKVSFPHSLAWTIGE